MSPARPVVFLDIGVLAVGLRLPSAVGRVGVLGNLPSGQGANQVRATLTRLGMGDLVEPELIVVASGLGCPLPNPRAFAAAAAVAGVPAERCSFVSADLAALIAAAAAGFHPVTLPASLSPVTTPSAATTTAELLAGEVDPDTGPTYILRGHVVTMRGKDDHIPNGRVVVSKGLIRAVLKPTDPVPAAFTQAPVVDTEGTIYPGLLDLHNHFVYNVLPLWVVPKKFKNRSQWPREAEYKSNVSKPIKDALAKFTHSSAAVIRYVEAKALIGGSTTGQGILTQTKVGKKAVRGGMRNVEDTKDARLPVARTRVPDLGSSEEQIAAFLAALKDCDAFFYHLSEGIDNAAHKHFENLRGNDLLRASLVGIHSLALTRDDLDAMAAAEAKIVWSPFSNMLLYTKTLNLADVKASGVRFCIGCDWSPTGSRNLLQELKVAEFENVRQGKPFTPFDLVRAVTSEAAAAVAWDKFLGRIDNGMMADLLVIQGTNAADPYTHLITATEPKVRLVTVHGVARYGDRAVLEKVHAGSADDLEEVEIAGAPKVFYFRSEEPVLNELTYKEAVERLKVAMADLPAFIERMEAEGDSLLALGVPTEQALTLEVDNEFHDDPLTEYPPEADLAAAGDVSMAESIDLDGPAVSGDADYMALVAKQTNIPKALIQHLKTRYGF